MALPAVITAAITGAVPKKRLATPAEARRIRALRAAA